MALWSRPDPAGAEPVENGEFEGRTAEEALDRARRALGPTAELRCWKTRRGGIGGFFATEVFVASVEPPAGAVAAASKGRRRRAAAAKEEAAAAATPEARPGPEVGAGGPRLITPVGTSGRTPDGGTLPAEPADGGRVPDEDLVPPMITYERPSRSTTGDPGADDTSTDDLSDSLAALAAGTTDQLSLDFDSIPSHSFDEVLAEAEAAVAGVSAWSERPGPSVQMVVAPPDEGAEAEATTPGAGSPVEGSNPGSAEVRPGTQPEAAGGDAEDRVGADPGPEGPDAGVDGADKASGATPTAPVTPTRSRRARPKGSASPRTPRRATAPTPSRPRDALPPQPIPDLFERLRVLGVPEAHLPDPGRLTLDTVVQAMDGLPEAPPLPTAPGSVVAVVGAAAAVERTTRLLLGAAPFRHGPRPDPSRRVWSPEDATGLDRPFDDVLQTGDPLEVAGRVARRRLDGSPSLVTVEVTPGHPMRSHERLVIASVQPDYVLGAIDASVKRADAVHWRDELDMIDALALWCLDDTVSPAELIGVLPIAFVDGVPGSSVTWTLSLLVRAAEGGG